MKRFFTLLFTALLLTAALCVSASASQYDSAAQVLGYHYSRPICQDELMKLLIKP